MFNSLFKVVALVVFLSSVSFATADGPDNWDIKGVVLSDTLNIRLEPNYKSKKVGEVPYNGTCLKNLGCTGKISMDAYFKLSPKEQKQLVQRRWCKIEYRGITGWVKGKFLKESGDCSSAPSLKKSERM